MAVYSVPGENMNTSDDNLTKNCVKYYCPGELYLN